MDNQAVIKNLKKPIVTSQLIWEAKELLNSLAQFNDVRIKYIPAHTRQLGNEIADRLAKRGAKNINTTIVTPVLPTSKNHLKKNLKMHYPTIKTWIGN